jgi:hypothetical protein
MAKADRFPVNPGDWPDANSKSRLDARLDQALEDTFPASDPFSVIISERPRRPPRQALSTSDAAADPDRGSTA